MLPRPDFPKALAVPGEAVRILLLEDDPLSVEIVSTYLRRIAFAQCELHSSATLSDALALLSRAKVDLVISDLHLPDSAGAATVAALVRMVGCPVIAITSDLNPFLRDAVLACGAYDFLQKADLTEATLSRLVRLAAMQARTFHSLRESEARFRALTELSSDWYWEQDAQLRFVGTSGQSDARGGITPQAHIGLCRWELPRTEIVGQTWDEHRRVLEARQPFHDLLLRRRAANGELSYVSVDGRPIFDASGAFTGYRGVAKEVTSRVAAEMALRESEARFRSLAGLSSDLYWEQDREFRFTAVSGIGPRIDSGRAQMLGKKRWERHYFNMTEAAWAAHRADLEARRPFRDLELGRINEEGAASWVTVSGEPMYGEAGHFVGYRGVGKDITARKREEALLALEHAVTLCLAEAKTAAAGVEGVLRTMCESLDWPAGRYFAADEEAGVLRFSQAWGKPLPGVEEFIARSRPLEYRRGHGLSGKVWQSGEPLWLKDVSKQAGASGSLQGTLQGGAFVFPVTSGEQVIGVMSFSSADVREPEARLLRAVGVIGSQVGQFLMRKKAEREERRRSEDLQRFRAAMDMAHDAIYLTERSTMRFLDANRVGCKALGYTREQLLSMGPHDVLAKSREELERDYDQVIARGAEGIRTEAAYTRKDGRTGWSELFRRALRSDEGWIIVTISRDITERKTEEGKLRRFRAALDAAAEPVLLVDARTGAYIDFNEAACRTFGYSREELLKLTVGDIRVDRTRERILQDYKRLAGDVDGDDMEISACRRKDGSMFPVEFTRRLVQTSDGPIVVASARDLTERLKADHRQAAVLKYQERVARFGQVALAQRQPAELIERAVQSVLEALGAEAVAYVEREPGEAAFVARALVGVADAGAQPTTVPSAPGSPMADAMHTGARTLVDGPCLPFPWAGMLRSTALLPVRGESGVRGLLCAGFKTSNAFAAEELNFAEAVASVLSTALQRIDSENRLAYLAQFDPLTGLANRTLLADRFSQMIVQAKRREVPVAVLFIDLDGFKTVNDTLGHAGGDELLKEVGRRLQATVRDGDTVARISGDEFAIVLADMAQLEDAALVAQKVIDRLAATVDIAGKEVFVTASVGIAIYPGDGADADTLIGAADAAMYRAKQSGRNTFQFFTAEINQRSRARAQMGAELRRALEREEFALVYQPKIDLTNRRVTGVEALLRWKHPTRGLVSPAEFIPVLEETGLIVPVGDWVLRRACEDLKAWRAAGLAVGPVAVNLSARQFRRGDLDSHIKALVGGVGIEASLIELEITESQLMQDPAHAIRVMRALRDAGMRIAIDDFGTGYSSLAYLNRFPVSALKIDRSFVKDMAKGKDDATIVRTIIEMAHSLGFTVVAEGVETEEQATFLRLLRCEQAQGYLFAKPMPAEDYVKLLSRS